MGYELDTIRGAGYMNPWLFILAGVAAATFRPELSAEDHRPQHEWDLKTRQVLAAEIGPYWPSEEDD